MEIIKLAWVGTRTERAEPTVVFFRDLLGASGPAASDPWSLGV